MTSIEEAKAAVERGEKVHWKNSHYTLRKDKRGEWWVDCSNGFISPLNGHKPEDFYIAMPDPTQQLTSDSPNLSLSEQVAAAVARIPEDQLRDAVAWTAEYLRQLRGRLPQPHPRSVDQQQACSPFVVPPFSPPPPSAITYIWWSWHPLYPYWSQSCWAAATIEAAQEHLEKGRLAYYHNKLIRHDGITLLEVQDEPCREMEIWHKIKRQMDEANETSPSMDAKEKPMP